MRLVSLSALPVDGYAWMPRSGGHAFVVIAKATFELTPGAARLAVVQDGLNERDNHWDDGPACSVYAPSDYAPFKKHVDITLVGDAFAPTDDGARSVVTRMSVAGVDKKIAVHCDRHLDTKGRVHEGKPFTRMALRYERAAGGRLSDNPVGIEPATKANRRQEKRRLPNVQPHGAPRKDRRGPVGYGPIGASWPTRRRLAKNGAKALRDRGWRERPLPKTLDVAYFNDAPVDQRVASLAPDARILLENLHPQLSRLATRLPGSRPKAFAEIDGEVFEVALEADTLWIDMTRGVCTITWRGSFEIASADQTGRVLVAMQKPGDDLTYADVDELQRPRATVTSDVRERQPSDAEMANAVPSSPSSEPSLTGPSIPPPSPPPRSKRASTISSADLSSSSLAAQNLTDSDVKWVAQPLQGEQRPRMNTVDLASGGEEYLRGGAPLPFVDPSPTETWNQGAGPADKDLNDTSRLPAMPSTPPAPPALNANAAAPTALSTNAAAPPALSTNAAASPAPAPPPPLNTAITPPSLSNTSPWAGKVAAKKRHDVSPPPTGDRDSVAPPPLMLVPEPSAPASRPRAPSPGRAPIAKRHRVDVLGYDAKELGRVRQTWELDDEQEQPADRLNRELREAFGATTVEPEMAERHLVRIMKSQEGIDVQGMREAMMDAVDEHGVFSAPLVLCHGSLRPSFDQVEVLRATIASVATYRKGNEALKEEVDETNDILTKQEVAPDVAQELTERIRGTFDESVDVAKVDARVERMLLERRAYQKKTLLRRTLVHATLTVDGESMPCYLAAPTANALPLFNELTVRIIAELHPRQDQHELSTRALRVIALGRVVARQEDC